VPGPRCRRARRGDGLGPSRRPAARLRSGRRARLQAGGWNPPRGAPAGSGARANSRRSARIHARLPKGHCGPGPEPRNSRRAPRRARLLCRLSRSLWIIERRCAADHHDATTSISICPMLGVHLRLEEGGPSGPTDDGPSAATLSLGRIAGAFRPSAEGDHPRSPGCTVSIASSGNRNSTSSESETK